MLGGRIGGGGATLASDLPEAGLLDELWLFTHPVILGRGRDLFDRVGRRIELDLIGQGDFDGGVTLHRYAVNYT